VTDEQLLRDGNDGAMAELVGRYERPLVHFLLRMVGERAAAEDLFQETFLRLHRGRFTFDARLPLRPYLYRIAVNAAREMLARNASRPRPVSLDGPSGGVSAVDCPADEAGDPVALEEGGEMKERVRSAVAALPPAEREVVHLRVFEGLKFREIAQITGVPLATAKSRMLYALRRLRPALETYLQGGEAVRKEAQP
jgi:RNA polymerase sigma-70 factor (ECF subfamily)